MPIIVFWLTPIILVIIFVLFLLSQQRGGKRKVFLVEPILFLVEKWRIARCQGDEKQLKSLLADWLPGLELQQSLIEQIARQIEDLPPLLASKDVTVVNQHGLPFWGELRQLEKMGKTNFVLMGPVSEIINYCDADPAGPITPEKRVSWPATAETAHKNGFWTIALAHSSSPDAMLRKKFRLAGLVILEPVLKHQGVIELRQAASQGEVRLMSIASPSFVSELLAKVFPELKVKAVSGLELSEMSPKDMERAVDSARVYGSVGSKTRYWIARHLQRSNYVVAFSNLPQDSDLPADQRLSM